MTTGNRKEFHEQKRRIEKKISILLNNTTNENPLPEKRLKHWEHNLENITSFLSETENTGNDDKDQTVLTAGIEADAIIISEQVRANGLM